VVKRVSSGGKEKFYCMGFEVRDVEHDDSRVRRDQEHKSKTKMESLEWRA
jgi:hypothetical protein